MPHLPGFLRRYLTRLAVAAAGDIAVFLIFAAVGRSSHGESGGVAHVLGIAWPFIVGWFLAAVPLGAFSPGAFKGGGDTFARVARSWVAGAIIALAIRSVIEGHIVPLTFVLIAFLFNLALLSGWRLALAALLKRTQ